MKKDNVLEAMTEARRFIDRCEEYLDRHHSDQAFRRYVDGGVGYAETDAVRRASMDLTCVLTKLRRNQ